MIVEGNHTPDRQKYLGVPIKLTKTPGAIQTSVPNLGKFMLKWDFLLKKSKIGKRKISSNLFLMIT
jgi:hypothetical protein